MLDGSITRLGTQYVLGLRAKDCRSGRVLAEEQAQAARKENVLNALSQIASRFRTHLGESLAHNLEIRFPEDTSVRFSYLPVLRGTLALNHGAPSEAIDLLRWPFLRIWARSAARFTASSALSILSSCAEMPISLRTGDHRRLPSFRRYSIIPES